MTDLKQYTLEEVSKHSSDKSIWLIIGNESNGEWHEVLGGGGRVWRWGFLE